MSLRLPGFVLAALALIAAPAVARGTTPARGAIDLEAAFATGFPAVADEHHVADWAMYAALVDGDIVGYAGRVDPELGNRLDEARGKAYQRQQLEVAIKKDQRLRVAFDEQRHRIQTMVLYADDGGEINGSCPRPVVYNGSEFRLILGARRRGADALASATVAPSCVPPSHPGVVQITAGRSPRFKCWSGVDDATCGWRLPDMPDSLKRVIESQYPSVIKLRWRWRGLGAIQHVRTVDPYGDGSGETTAVAVTTPLELGLEFVDVQGRVLWTAAGAATRQP